MKINHCYLFMHARALGTIFSLGVLRLYRCVCGGGGGGYLGGLYKSV